MSLFLLSQIAAGSAVICNLLSFQFKRRAIVISFLSAAVFLVGLQYYFLNEYSAAWMTSYALVYFLVSLKTTDRKLMWCFMLGGFVIFFITYQKVTDFFPLFSTVVTLFSLYTPNQKRMREWQAIGATSRIIFYTIIFSPLGILLEATLLISNITAYWRFYIKKS